MNLMHINILLFFFLSWIQSKHRKTIICLYSLLDKISCTLYMQFINKGRNCCHRQSLPFNPRVEHYVTLQIQKYVLHVTLLGVYFHHLFFGRIWLYLRNRLTDLDQTIQHISTPLFNQLEGIVSSRGETHR